MIKESIYDILKQVIPNELSNHFDITDEEAVNIFIEDIIVDIEDNLDEEEN